MGQDTTLRFSADFLSKNLQETHANYFKFIDNANLSSGIYILKAGQEDPQSPHLYDELYYILEGESDIQIAGKTVPVRTGDVIFIPAQADHRFLNITSDLKLLVFFTKSQNSP